MNERMEIALPISLDALLLLLLGLSHLWYNPVSSALMVTIMVTYLLLDMVQRDHLKTQHPLLTKERLIFTAKLFLATLFIFIAVVLPTLRNIADRHASQPYMYAHDGLIQTEEAIKFLLVGKNPYTEEYINTPMAKWQGYSVVFGEEVPAPLLHNVYLPLPFLFSIPFYLVSKNVLGWYDQRFVYLLLFIGLLILLPRLTQEWSKKLGLLLGFGLNLYFTIFFANGNNDAFVLFWLVLTIFLLQWRQVALSSVALALACTSKQSALLLLPFYFLYLMRGSCWRESATSILKKTYPFFIISSLIIVPFLAWDPISFIDDTINYLAGGSEVSFPIYGHNLGTLLLATGLVESKQAYFPFWMLQALFGLPTLLWLLREQSRDNNVRRVCFNFAITSFVFGFLSRYLLDSHLGFIVALFTIAYFSDPTRLSMGESDASEEPRSI
ncbi:MAG: hypothetical protein ACE5LG_00780 [Anaerolineae bacterium]